MHTVICILFNHKRCSVPHYYCGLVRLFTIFDQELGVTHSEMQISAPGACVNVRSLLPSGHQCNVDIFKVAREMDFFGSTFGDNYQHLQLWQDRAPEFLE